jgi:thiamine-phosphate pyrophosphorylase
MIDANANRAAEGLRVAEDVARFALDHKDLARQLKDLRHGLAAALAALPGGDLLRLAHRDTEGDVGTAIKATAEASRAGLRSIAAAAMARVTQALRVIEESTKSLAPTTAPAFEALRYRAYTVERDLLLALPTGRAPQWRLCVLITESLCRHPWDEVAAAAIDGGADCLQLREKSLSARELTARAAALVTLAKQSRCAAIINDRPDVALITGADGVHLGQDDLTVAHTRALAGDRLLVGVSTHNLDEATRAAHSGADYCGVGAMFPTATKARETSGVEYLRAYLASPTLAAIPHLAIGGIAPDNIGLLNGAGVRGVAVSSCVCAADDPAAVCRALIAAGAPTPTP